MGRLVPALLASSLGVLLAVCPCSADPRWQVTSADGKSSLAFGFLA